MKKFKILFIVTLVASLAIGSAPLFAVSAMGLAFTQYSYKLTGYSFLTMVPGVIVVQNPAKGPEYGTLMEVPPMTRAEKALFDYLRSKSNAVTYDAIQSGAISFDPISYYMRFAITGLSGNQQIVGPNTLYTRGVTNFTNGATLPQYYNFCFDRIAVRYAVAASAAAAPYSTAGYSSVGSSMDPGLRNGQLIVKSNRNDIVNTPIVDFISAAAVTGGGLREYDGGILEKPRFFLEQLQIEVNIDLPQAVAAVANNTYLVEVQFSGVQARLKF
jgi:hypothetical protein